MLRVDTRIDCNSSTYSIIFCEAVFMAVVFVLGVPVFWLWSLRKHRADIQQTGDDGEVSVAAQQFSFLVGAYQPEYYLWEVAELARKVVLTGFVSVVSPGSMLQIVVASSASLCFLAMHSRCCTSTPHATLLRLVL